MHKPWINLNYARCNPDTRARGFNRNSIFVAREKERGREAHSGNVRDGYWPASCARATIKSMGILGFRALLQRQRIRSINFCLTALISLALPRGCSAARNTQLNERQTANFFNITFSLLFPAGGTLSYSLPLVGRNTVVPKLVF